MTTTDATDAMDEGGATPQTERPLHGKVALVTGASRGIGKATAREFARAGAAVALAARDSVALAANVAEIAAAGSVALACPCDVAEEASVQAVFARVAATLGPVDILVNSAGAVAQARFEQMEAATWDHVLGVNLRGVFLCCREAFRAMIPRGGGVIVNLSSLSGTPNVEKFPGLSAYNVSKYGVAGLSEILALEGRPHPISASSLSAQARWTPRCCAPPRRTSRPT